jgi:dihydropteroate synthase
MRNFIKTSHRKIFLDKRPLIMGILNVTPDSFSDGGRYFSTEKAVEHALEMQSQGADIIDVGGESTRPGSLPVTDDGEIERVLPVLRKLTGLLRIPLSIDTSKSNVAEACLAEGAEIVNDISGLRFDPRMASVAAAAGAAVVIMHTKSAPRVMQVETEYDALLDDIASYIKYGISRAIEAGISDDSIIIDPGIGFGKTKDQNLIILKNLDYFKYMGYPVLIGTSKKSFIGAALNVGIDERLEGTLAVDALVTLKGADIIRTHDVIATRRVVEMVRAVETAPSWV